MTRKSNSEIPVLSDISLEQSEGISFGEYLRSVRKVQGFSIRQLAKAVSKTPTYISDIERGNNKPPDKELLEQIIRILNLESFPDVKENLFNFAAQERGDVPADIKEYVINDKFIISIIRAVKERPDGKEIWAEMASRYCNS